MELTAKFWVKFRAGVKDREGFDYRYPFPVLAIDTDTEDIILADKNGKLTKIPSDDVRLVSKKDKLLSRKSLAESLQFSTDDMIEEKGWKAWLDLEGNYWIYAPDGKFKSFVPKSKTVDHIMRLLKRESRELHAGV